MQSRRGRPPTGSRGNPPSPATFPKTFKSRFKRASPSPRILEASTRATRRASRRGGAVTRSITPDWPVCSPPAPSGMVELGGVGSCWSTRPIRAWPAPRFGIRSVCSGAWISELISFCGIGLLLRSYEACRDVWCSPCSGLYLASLHLGNEESNTEMSPTSKPITKKPRSLHPLWDKAFPHVHSWWMLTFR